MDIKQYIASGTIEACLTGGASEEDIRQLDRLCQEYPEVRKAVDEVKVTLERYATLYATTPPKALKKEIWEQIETSVPSKGQNKRSPRPEKTSSIPAQTGWIKYVAVAASILLLASVIMNIYLWNKSNTVADKIANLEEQLHQTQKENIQKTAMDQKNLDIALSANMKRVLLEGVKKHKDSKGLVFWDPSSQEVYLSLTGLPKTPEDKQYQLWAIIDGKPVSAGVYTKSKSSSDLQKMQTISSQPQKFAVTLEKKGGAKTPDLSAMYVAGEI